MKEKPRRNVGKNERDNYLGLRVALSVSLLSLILMRIINTQHSHEVPCDDFAALAERVKFGRKQWLFVFVDAFRREAFSSHFGAAV